MEGRIIACASCGKNKKGNGYITPKALDSPPMGATDIQVYENNSIRKFNSEDWINDRHKLIIFFPEIFTPVCQSELGALPKWIKSFDEQNTDVFACSTDPIMGLQDWYETEDALSDVNYRVLSSYILPTRLGVMNNGRAKRASIFISKDGDVVIQEYPLKVGRSLSEIHRMIFAYNTDSFCGENWSDPSEGFLDANGQE